MWVWTLNWGEIRHDLVIGSCPIHPSDIDRIYDNTGVSAVLSVQTDDCRAALGIDYRMLEERASSRGLLLLNAPIYDFDADDQRKRLPGAVAQLCKLLSGGHRTYLHCTAGINRAPLVALAYLTFVEGMALPDAFALIQRGRPEASPYWNAYSGCREDAIAPHRAAVAVRAWNFSQANPEETPDGNWFRAEQEILREAFA
jgi:dual specificity protein phosphatase-like protein